MKYSDSAKSENSYTMKATLPVSIEILRSSNANGHRAQNADSETEAKSVSGNPEYGFESHHRQTSGGAFFRQEKRKTSSLIRSRGRHDSPAMKIDSASLA
jgi:hypothetical protein